MLFFQKPLCPNFFPIYTRLSITGTSQNNPIVVPNAAWEPNPYILMAVAIAISKWLEEPMITEIIASRYPNPISLVMNKFNPTTIAKPSKRGMETRIISSGCWFRIFPFKEKNTSNVVKRATIATFPTLGR